MGYQRRHDRVHGVDVYSIAAGPEVPFLSGVAPTAADMVLVHGLAMSNRYLVPCLGRVAADRRVFAPDLPGVGRSSRPSRQLTMVELADGLSDWMGVVGVGRAVVIGHSLGALVVAHLAARHPARVEAVVLVSPARDPEHRTWWQGAWRLLLDAPRERWSLLPIAVTDYVRVGAYRMLRTLRAARRSDAATSLSNITQATLVVCGERDPLVSRDWAQRLTTLLPCGSLTTIAGAPHAVPYSSVEPFVAAVRRFLSGPGGCAS